MCVVWKPLLDRGLDLHPFGTELSDLATEVGYDSLYLLIGGGS